MKAMILAAGFGTRLLPYTRLRPKPLFTLSDRPLLDLMIERLQAAGCRAIVVNTHHLHEHIAAHIAKNRYAIPVGVRNEPEILGTGGAIKNVADFWDDEPFLVVNSDIVTDIDFRPVYETHCRSDSPATLVMHDYPQFNNVAVDRAGYIIDFDAAPSADGPNRILAFTGIQVVNPELLDMIPERTFYSIIDAYRRLISMERRVKAHVVQDHYWRDIGTPQSYRQAVFDAMAPQAFAQIAAPPVPHAIQRMRLAGDGSDRTWYRLVADAHSLIMADHGLRQDAGGQSEVDAFVDIGRHLYEIGVPVPRILAFDRFAGLVILEDLGDQNLQRVVREATGAGSVIKLYRTVIDELVNMAFAGRRNFNTAWTYQTVAYDRKLILEKECAYFVDAFLRRYLGWNTSYAEFAEEFERIARRTLACAWQGFMHRDFQSRNILIKDNRCYFIDFQGGRLGPLQYDLASLLIDPYVQLPEEIRERLLDYAGDRMQMREAVDMAKFRRGYRHCALTRNLQILGAFGYLSKVKGKSQFEGYIPAAVASLRDNLGRLTDAEFPKLRSIADRLVNRFQSR